MKTMDKSNPRVKTPFDSTFCLLPSAIAVTDVPGRVDHVIKRGSRSQSSGGFMAKNVRPKFQVQLGCAVGHSRYHNFTIL
jgi:hypothetical protein